MVGFWEKSWTADAHDAGLWWASGKKAGQLMLMMLACGLLLAKCWAADVHDAGLRRAFGKTCAELMLIMLACVVLLGNKLDS